MPVVFHDQLMVQFSWNKKPIKIIELHRLQAIKQLNEKMFVHLIEWSWKLFFYIAFFDCNKLITWNRALIFLWQLSFNYITFVWKYYTNMYLHRVSQSLECMWSKRWTDWVWWLISPMLAQMLCVRPWELLRHLSFSHIRVSFTLICFCCVSYVYGWYSILMC